MEWKVSHECPILRTFTCFTRLWWKPGKVWSVRTKNLGDIFSGFFRPLLRLWGGWKPRGKVWYQCEERHFGMGRLVHWDLFAPYLIENNLCRREGMPNTILREFGLNSRKCEVCWKPLENEQWQFQKKNLILVEQLKLSSCYLNSESSFVVCVSLCLGQARLCFIVLVKVLGLGSFPALIVPKLVGRHQTGSWTHVPHTPDQWCSNNLIRKTLKSSITWLWGWDLA